MKIPTKDFVNSLSFEERQQLIAALKEEPNESKNLKTNEELIDEFINSLKAENTKKMYRHALNKFKDFIKGKNLQLVTKIDLEKHYYNYLNNSKLRKESKRLRFAAVVSFYNFFICQRN